MVNDLLIMSRMDAGKVALKIETFSLKPLLSQIIELFEQQAEEKQLKITMEYSDKHPFIQADKKDMEKVFSNLINNAVKYNKDGGIVHIRVRADSAYLIVEIADEGIGMKPGEIGLIFDEFYRIESAKTKRIPGTGLGLAIAKKIVDSHHGRIEVKSREGEGSTFTVWLPFKRD
jgi:two-component system sensor histidine kinase VicK